MDFVAPIGGGVSACVSMAIDELLREAALSPNRIVDVRHEAERIRSTVAGANVLSVDDLIRMIGSKGASLGMGLEFR
jgi:hypothetical protein